MSRGKASPNPFEPTQTRTDVEHDPVVERDKGRPTPKALSTEGSIIPGESEEDGIIRKEYVLVGDVRVVEFGRAVDGNYFLFRYSCRSPHQRIYRT